MREAFSLENWVTTRSVCNFTSYTRQRSCWNNMQSTKDTKFLFDLFYHVYVYCFLGVKVRTRTVRKYSAHSVHDQKLRRQRGTVGLVEYPVHEDLPKIFRRKKPREAAFFSSGTIRRSLVVSSISSASSRDSSSVEGHPPKLRLAWILLVGCCCCCSKSFAGSLRRHRARMTGPSGLRLPLITGS
jgi:hypothetical protein